MKINGEQDILDQKVRAAVIKEILGTENMSRKYEAYKRFMCFKDRTSDFVIEQLKKQFDDTTVQEMWYCITNVSIVRKVIDKLARVYSNGVTRTITGDESATETLSRLSKELSFNTEIKKTNKFLKLQKNVAMYVKPCAEENGKYGIKLEPMNPYLYDVIENPNKKTEPMVYILSNFQNNPDYYTIGDAAFAGRSSSVQVINRGMDGDGVDQSIADSASDANKGEYIWWSKNYHFTTNEKGEIISSGDGLNPIKRLPLINFAIEQDGSFWAQGGNDLIDGAISANSMLTNIKHVAITQGYGLFWMKGKKVPTNIKVGPNKLIRMEYEDGDPEPSLGFASANPEIEPMKALVETDVALLLTTNNLSTSAVSASLQGNTDPASGIAMMLDKAESREDVEDQRQIFLDKEPEIWEAINAWILAYGDNICDELKGLILPPNFEENFVLKFNDQQVIQSESEKLDNIKKRKELGLNTKEELILIDNPQLSQDEAKAKAMALEETKPNADQEDNSQ